MKFYLNLEGEKSVSVLSPNGGNVDLKTTSIYTNTSQVGVHTVLVDDQPVGRFAVNLLNAFLFNFTKIHVLAQNLLIDYC